MRRAILASAALIAFSQTATAGVSCTVVRFYVAKYSEATAERWARSHGASEAEIETARRCLHPSPIVQTASTTSKSQVLAAVSEQERTEHARVARDQAQNAPNVVAVQSQRAEVYGPVRPKDAENHSAGHVSNEKDLAPSDGKTTAMRPGTASAMHRAHSAGLTGQVAWLKRLWSHLVGRRRSIALFTLPRSRSYRVRPLWHHFSSTVPSHGAG
jgi:hypothetical protein